MALHMLAGGTSRAGPTYHVEAATRRSRLQHSQSSSGSGSSSQAAERTQQVDMRPLAERLKGKVDVLPPALLKRFIAHVKRTVNPVLSEGARKVIQEFYVRLRARYVSEDSVPITTRQLEALIRLTQARARIELRAEATAHDAIDAVEIVKESMVDVAVNDDNQLDFARSASGMSQTKASKVFVQQLHRTAEQRGDAVFSRAELRDIADQLGVQVPDFGAFVDSLNLQGVLLKRSAGLFKLLGAKTSGRRSTLGARGRGSGAPSASAAGFRPY